MSYSKVGQIDRIERYANLIQKQTGKAVRPYRADGYMNLLNKYGTARDTTEHYEYVSDALVDDSSLAINYEGNGLFAKIIDTPAEEAVKNGFTLKNITDKSVIDFYESALDELDFEETAINCLRWSRLFGGAIAVLLINDGRGIDEPLDWKNIQSIDDIRVYDRSVIQPDYQSMYSYDPHDPFGSRGSRLGMPEYYHVNSIYGSFTVHESRCLVFQNGSLPEKTTSEVYRIWGMPEYMRLSRALRDCEIAHGSAVKMLDKSVQAVYKMNDLSMELSTDEGENRVLKRLQVIDMARGLLNSIAIDKDGEEYDFRSFQFSGVSSVVDVTCNFLSALTSIPQTILFGRSPAGMNATGESDFENYYNYVRRIQKRSLKSNLRYLLSVVFQAGVATGEIEKVPPIIIEFNPLWQMTESEKLDSDLKRAQIQQSRAALANAYITANVLSPQEVRMSLVKSGDFDIDTTFDDIDEDEETFSEIIEKLNDHGGLAPSSGEQGGEGQPQAPAVPATPAAQQASKATPTGITGQSSPDAAPAATKLPQDMNQEEQTQLSTQEETQNTDDSTTFQEQLGSVGILVVKDGKILTGVRKSDEGSGLICGPGGHIEPYETPEMTAVRETYEEFGVYVNELIPLGKGKQEPETGLSPELFLCTDFTGEPTADENEMTEPRFLSIDEIKQSGGLLFAPFADGLQYMLCAVSGENEASKERILGRKDSSKEDVEWITVNGAHIPVDSSGDLQGEVGEKIEKKERSAKKSESGTPVRRHASSSIEAQDKYRKSLLKEKKKVMALDDDEKGEYLLLAGYKSEDELVVDIALGTIGRATENYFRYLERNGNTDSEKPVSGNDSKCEVYVEGTKYTDSKKARVAKISELTGMSDTEAKRVYKNLQQWFSGNMKDSDTEVLDRFIESDHTYEGEIFRGLKFWNPHDYEAFMQKAMVGDVICNDCDGKRLNASWSSDIEVATQFSGKGTGIDSIMLRCVKNRSSSPVACLSPLNEHEVISHSKAQWTVIASNTQIYGDGKRYTELTVVENGDYYEQG